VSIEHTDTGDIYVEPRNEVVITVGYPGSGKGTHVKPLLAKGYQCFNRDSIGGGTNKDDSGIYREAQKAFDAGCRRFVFDNTYGTIQARSAAITFAKSVGLPIRVLWLQTTLEQAQLFASRRQVQRLGKLLRKEEYKAHSKDANMFPPGAQYAYRKRFEPPTTVEGFTHVKPVPVAVTWGSEYTNKALILDFDGTLRETPDEKACPYPRTTAEVKVPAGRGDKLREYLDKGYRLLGASNQSGISRMPDDPKFVSEEAAKRCFAETCRQLGVDIEVLYATERGGPPQSFWRKPVTGMAVLHIERHKLDPRQCICVGDWTSDKSFAERAGFQFVWAHEFFA